MGVGERIHDLRRAERLTQEQFAQKIGIKRAHVSNLEKGRYNPSEQLLVSISRAFGVRLAWLKSGTGQIFDKTPRFTGDAKAFLTKVAESMKMPDPQLALNTVAKMLDVDPADVPFVTAERGEVYIIDRELDARSRLKKMIEQLDRIYKGGDQKKLEAIEQILEQFDPGERKEKKKLA